MSTSHPHPSWRRMGALVVAVVVGVVAPLALLPARAGGAQPPPDPTATTVAPAPAAGAPADPAATTVAPTPSAVPAEPETERLDDPEARRTIDLLIGLLIAVAVVLLVVTAWFWRSTKPTAPVLEPLAVMSTRRFRRRSADKREDALQDIHALRTAAAPAPRAADLLRQAQSEE